MAATNKLDAFGQRVGVIDPKEGADQAAALPQTEEQKRLRTLIERRHPKYTEKKDHWEFLEDTYEGGREWFEDNIFRYVKEGDKEFAERKRRAYRFNHTREVVDLLNKYLFRQNITRNDVDAPESVKEFWKKTTRNGLGISDFSRQISRASSTFGRIAIVIDSNVPAGQNISRAEAKKNGYGTYGYIVRPTHLLDYSFDDRGDLNWALIQETYRDDSDPLSGEASDMKARWRLWTKAEWMLIEEESVGKGKKKRLKVSKRGEHGLGVCPVIIHDNIITDEEWCSQALIDDIAYLDRAVANYLSNLDAIIQDQTFSQLAMPAQGLMPGEDNYNKMLEMGTKRVFLFDGEGGSVPMYISPDVKQAQVIVTTIQKIINEIYHTVGLAGERTKEDNAVGIDNSSGVAKAYDFERVNSLLAAKADALQITENRIAKLVAKWNSDDIEDDLVSYPDDFDTRGLYDEFDIAARLLLIEAPDEVRREQMSQVIHKLFPQASKEVKKRFEESLKEWPIEPEEIETPDTPAKAGDDDDAPKPAADNRQGQVTADTE